MKKRILPAALVGAALVATLGLAGCGASLDRDVEVAGMTVSVPSDWEQKSATGNTDAEGEMAYERFTDDADDPYTAIVIRYEGIDDESPADAGAAMALKQMRMEQDFGIVEWDIDEEKTEIVDGAQVTTYEYSFDKEIDHVTKTYEYQTAYVFAEDAIYEISVYGDQVAIADVVGSIEL